MTLRISAATAKRLRLVGKVGVARGKPPRRTEEADLQKALAKQLYAMTKDGALRASFWTASNNGVRLTTIKARIRSKEQGVNPGLADLLFLGMDREWYLLEMKARKGTVRPEQRALGDAMKPGHYRVARSIPEAMDALMGWGLL